MFSRMYHVLSHKTSLNKFQWIEIISSTFETGDQVQKEKQEKNKHIEIKHTTKKMIDSKKISRVNQKLPEDK